MDSPVCILRVQRRLGASGRLRLARVRTADAVINRERLEDEILFDRVVVTPNSCALAEQCVGGVGRRRVLRFSVEAINQGPATMVVQNNSATVPVVITAETL